MKRVIFLAMVVVLAMLILVPMGVAQETTMATPSPVPGDLEGTGGPAILLPAAALLLGSGILTYAILRRR